MTRMIHLICLITLTLLMTIVPALSSWERTLTAEWEYTPPDGDTVKQFNLYSGDAIVATFDGDDRSGTFATSLTARTNNYTLTAVLDDDTESPPSDVYVYKDKGPKGKITKVIM